MLRRCWVLLQSSGERWGFCFAAVTVVRLRLQVPSLLLYVVVQISAERSKPLRCSSGLSRTCAAHGEPETCVVSFSESGNLFSSSLHSGHCTGSSSKKDGLALTVSAVCPSALLCEWPPAPPPRAMPRDTEDSPLQQCPLHVLLPFIICLILFLYNQDDYRAIVFCL